MILNDFKRFITIVRELVSYIKNKYIFTINHKRLAINYFYFTLLTGFSGATLATAIRVEMSYPGSPFFGGDSLKYLQVITAHAIIMIFFVVVPIFFGFFANFFIPYHVGSKDVAYPRLNSLGFWIQPCGYLLIAKIGFLRVDHWKNNVKKETYFDMLNTPNIDKLFNNSNLTTVLTKYYYSNWFEDLIEDKEAQKFVIFLDPATQNIHPMPFRDDLNTIDLSDYESLKKKTPYNWLVYMWKEIYSYTDSLKFLMINSSTVKQRKRHIVKCSTASQTVSGWTFITPFSSKLEYTGIGAQDMLILGVYFAGISTTISVVNLLMTRRCLSAPGLRSRRVLLPFITISLLLMLRALAVITPILGSAMLMLLLDRYWSTSFFDFTYGGDPVFFHHLFWFFGHPEVYVLVIPAFGVVNSVLPYINTRRVASKHHLIWAIYIMNYMGFLVWGHHMYLIGLDHRSRALYSTVTILISLPATIKVVNWTYSLLNGVLIVDSILYAFVSFMLFFLVAGLTGMWLSHVSLDISMHDTLYVVAHFHLMLSGAVLTAIILGFYFYFPLIFKVKLSKTLSNFQITYYTAGQWLTFIPMFWVAFSGLPRRVHDFPGIFIGWQSFSTAGHFITMFGVLLFFATILESIYEGKLASNPYHLVPRLLNRSNLYSLKYLHSIYGQKNKDLINLKIREIFIKGSRFTF